MPGLRELQQVGSAVAFSGLLSTGSVVVVRGLSCPTSTWDLPRPHVSCVGRQIPYCWTTGEAPSWADFGKNSWSTLTCMNASGQLCSSAPAHVFSEIMGRHCWFSPWNTLPAHNGMNSVLLWTLTEELTPWIRSDFCFQTFSVSFKCFFFSPYHCWSFALLSWCPKVNWGILNILSFLKEKIG